MHGREFIRARIDFENEIYDVLSKWILLLKMKSFGTNGKASTPISIPGHRAK
jgi:hypothetical protein